MVLGARRSTLFPYTTLFRSPRWCPSSVSLPSTRPELLAEGATSPRDRKSTRLNSSHRCISYAVFCLKKNKHARRRVHHLERRPTIIVLHTIPRSVGHGSKQL